MGDMSFGMFGILLLVSACMILIYEEDPHTKTFFELLDVINTAHLNKDCSVHLNTPKNRTHNKVLEYEISCYDISRLTKSDKGEISAWLNDSIEKRSDIKERINRKVTEALKAGEFPPNTFLNYIDVSLHIDIYPTNNEFYEEINIRYKSVARVILMMG